jgi:hypothetical protein
MMECVAGIYQIEQLWQLIHLLSSQAATTLDLAGLGVNPKPGDPALCQSSQHTPAATSHIQHLATGRQPPCDQIQHLALAKHDPTRHVYQLLESRCVRV